MTKEEMQYLADLLKPLKDSIDSLDTEVSKLNLLVENTIRPDIKIIAEGHLDLNNKLDVAIASEKNINRQINAIQDRVSVLELKKA